MQHKAESDLTFKSSDAQWFAQNPNYKFIESSSSSSSSSLRRSEGPPAGPSPRGEDVIIEHDVEGAVGELVREKQTKDTKCTFKVIWENGRY